MQVLIWIAGVAKYGPIGVRGRTLARKRRARINVMKLVLRTLSQKRIVKSMRRDSLEARRAEDECRRLYRVAKKVVDAVLLDIKNVTPTRGE